MILKPSTLDFFSAFQPGKGLELTDLVTLVPPRYNQLTLFDPRLPHGVRPVHGTRDPMKSRLVLHGGVGGGVGWVGVGWGGALGGCSG